MSKQRMKISTLVPLAAVALAAVACGGHGAAHAGARAAANSSGQVQAGASTSVQSGISAGAKGSAVASGKSGSQGGVTKSGTRTGSSPAPGTSPSPTGPATHREIPLDATLSAPCVTPGGSQTLTVHGDPNWRVVFDTRYPDGKDGQVYGGIDYRGTTGASGTYLMTWTVSVAAPPGAADVEAAAVGDGVTAHSRLPFKIALHCS
jgi:hypothetical protein